MFSHSDIWHAIDKYAERRGISVSALAKQAQLDSSSFNPSKRTTGDGKKRWPSTESISKILKYSDGTMEELISLISGDPETALNMRMPFLLSSDMSKILSDSGPDAVFNADGFLRETASQGQIYLPARHELRNFALELTTSAYEPVYRNGSVLVISPDASIRRGDRLLIITSTHDLQIFELVRQTAHRMDLASIADPTDVETIMANDVFWHSRIIWASQ